MPANLSSNNSVSKRLVQSGPGVMHSARSVCKDDATPKMAESNARDPSAGRVAQQPALANSKGQAACPETYPSCTCASSLRAAITT